MVFHVKDATCTGRFNPKALDFARGKNARSKILYLENIKIDSKILIICNYVINLSQYTSVKEKCKNENISLCKQFKVIKAKPSMLIFLYFFFVFFSKSPYVPLKCVNDFHSIYY